jgi:membrane-associated phospholipid phosphatase
MRFADVEQWLGGGVLVAWLLVAGLSMAGRLPVVRGLRRSTLIGTGVAAGLFALQASVVDAVADPDGISAADPPVLQWMVEHRSPVATTFFRLVAAAGGTAGMTVLASIAVLILLVRRRVRHAVVVAAAGVGSSLLVTLLKDLYQRPRPPVATRLGPETNYSLPSGHALGSIVVLGAIAAVVVLLARRTWLRVATVAVVALAVVAIGSSRLYLGVHWLTDVLDGWLVGGTWLTLCVTFLVAGQPGAGTPLLGGATGVALGGVGAAGASVEQGDPGHHLGGRDSAHGKR